LPFFHSGHAHAAGENTVLHVAIALLCVKPSSYAKRYTSKLPTSNSTVFNGVLIDKNGWQKR